MAWPLDRRFDIPENRDILSFIRNHNPSAHDEATSALQDAAEGLGDAAHYCPDLHAYAYMVLHTESNRIFGIAYGMSAIAFRLPPTHHASATAGGGKVDGGLGTEWFEFPAYRSDEPLAATRAQLRCWCNLALEYAAIPPSRKPKRR